MNNTIKQPFFDAPPLGKSVPLGGGDVHKVTSVGVQL